MASMYKQFETDTTLEKKGIVLDYGPFRVTIARAGGANDRYAKVLERESKPYRRALETQTMDATIALKMMYKVYAESIVLNWEVLQKNKSYKKGIEGPKGNLLPFTKDNVIATFMALQDLYLDIFDQAQLSALFRQEDLDGEAKNS